MARGENQAAQRMRAHYKAGNVKAARAEALAILGDAAASPADKEEARKLRERSDIDPRALGIGFAALALGVVMVVVFILLRR